MKREDAALVLEALYGDWDALDESNWQALRKAIAALRDEQPTIINSKNVTYTNGRQLVPDHETGLVPCGCGGEATVRGDYELMWAYKCNSCGIKTGGHTELVDARDAWNTAMGCHE